MGRDFRHVIRRMRAAAGLSQSELARRLGTTQSAVARWEGGDVSPRLDTVARVADACGLDAQLVWNVRQDAPSEWRDPVIEAYKKDIDRTLLRENLKLTVEQRLQQHQEFARFADKFRGVAREHP